MGSVDVPKQQRAAVREGSGDDARAPVKQIDVTMPGKGQILVKVNWTGLCASVSPRTRLAHQVLLVRVLG